MWLVFFTFSRTKMASLARYDIYSNEYNKALDALYAAINSGKGFLDELIILKSTPSAAEEKDKQHPDTELATKKRVQLALIAARVRAATATATARVQRAATATATARVQRAEAERHAAYTTAGLLDAEQPPPYSPKDANEAVILASGHNYPPPGYNVVHLPKTLSSP